MTENYPREEKPRCFYDTNVLAAYILSEEGRLEKAEHAIRSCETRGVSVITLHELSYIALKRSLEEKLDEAIALTEKVFSIHELTRGIALKAAHIRFRHGIPEVDSLILATAVNTGYNIFYTFDSDFRSLNGKTIGQTRIVYLQ